jgi:hypothetical protein
MVALVAALVLALLTHFTACTTDSDHVSTFERAGKNHTVVALVKRSGELPEKRRELPLPHFPRLAAAAFHPEFPATVHAQTDLPRAAHHRNSALAHRDTVVLLV